MQHFRPRAFVVPAGVRESCGESWVLADESNSERSFHALTYIDIDIDIHIDMVRFTDVVRWYMQPARRARLQLHACSRFTIGYCCNSNCA